VALLPGDCPLLDPRELDRMLTGVPDPYVAVIPDRHGTGTNALVLTPPDALTPAYGEGSCARHLRLAEQQGAAPEVVPVPGLPLDVDSGEDLAQLRTILAEVRGGAAHTRGLLAQLDRSLR
jgi:2-phospho-L-lactate guanylyltransferase